jgi:CheY-like chemotaxis protein
VDQILMNLVVNARDETLAHVFEPFFTTKAIGKGTGLGLATVHGIVTQNGGVAVVNSEIGRGTTFRIYVPRLDETAAAAGAVEEMPAAGAGGTVLLVEDDDAVRRTLADMLDALGFAVHVAAGWHEALRVAGRPDLSIDVLLTDVVMPELSGKDLCERIRALRTRLPALSMSGYTADAIAHHGILEEDIHFIQKPFTMDDLARAIRTAPRHRP